MTDTLPPPTYADLVDEAVRVLNDLVVYALAVREVNRDVITDDQFDAIVEADYFINSIQDTITWIAAGRPEA